MRHKEGGFHHPAAQTFQPAAVENLFDVRRFAPAVAGNDAPERRRYLFNLHATNVMYVRRVFGTQREQNHPLVQHLVMLQVVQQRERNHVQRTGHINSGTRHANRRRFFKRRDHRLQRITVLMHPTQKAETLAFPGGHDGKHHQTEGQRQPAAGDDFIEVRGEERDINAHKGNQQQRHNKLIPVPVLPRHRREQNGGQHHRSGHRNTVCRRQIRGVLKVNNHDDHRDIEQPVDKRDVNLPGLHFRGVNNTHRRQVPQTHGLASQREDAGDNRL